MNYHPVDFDQECRDKPFSSQRFPTCSCTTAKSLVPGLRAQPDEATYAIRVKTETLAVPVAIGTVVAKSDCCYDAGSQQAEEGDEDGRLHVGCLLESGGYGCDRDL